ncbi:hypothetical protein [Saccharicrinis aurantiacus]|uniref:hypothetical protein n=1 Tax=Saccharicrinis aurantiacus TaxID=1849719 RepID=UPI000838923F|nr:hypothetical protein [Saccharicrinis aurantiacus]
MKRYHVIKKLSANNEHLNDQDLLPASCKIITGIAVTTNVKKEAEAVDGLSALAFPQGLITRLLASDQVAHLFYSYMRTRPTLDESKAFFESDILPEMVKVLLDGINYPSLSDSEQITFSSKLNELLMGGSDQAEIDWDGRFTDLKTEYKAHLFAFLLSTYGAFGFDPETDLEAYDLDLLFNASTSIRSNALYQITSIVYYKIRSNEYLESYSTVSKSINTYGNSIMQDYDRELAQLQLDKLAYEQAETQGLAHYLFAKVSVFEKGKGMESLAFTELIAQETLSFIYQNRNGLFVRPVQKYLRPAAYECGSLSLLVNGNSFLLRDYTLTANRNIKYLSKEVIPFSEPLDVNSSIHTVYKSNMKSGTEPLNIRIYIQYEDFKEPLAELEPQKQEAEL